MRIPQRSRKESGDVRVGSLADRLGGLRDVRYSPRANIGERIWDARFGPIGDIWTACSKGAPTVTNP
jgi:hypothetical protein